MNFIPKDLNPEPYFPHPTSSYTCGVTITLMVRDGPTSITNVDRKSVV